MSDHFAAREKGFEVEFARNQELAFRFAARRNRLFGLWAAGRLDLPAAESSAYAAAIMAAALDAQTDDDVIGKVRGDCNARGLDMPEAELRRAYANAAQAARQQLGAP